MKRFLVWLDLLFAVLLVASAGLAQETQEKQKLISLTFDDGPRLKVLAKLLPILEKEGIRATFFINGYNFNQADQDLILALRAKEKIESLAKGVIVEFAVFFDERANWSFVHLIRNISKSGHSFQNHGYSHKSFRKIEEENARQVIFQDIERNADLIEALTDKKPSFLRPPFGVIWPDLKKDIENLGYRVVGADIDSNDYLYQGVEARERIVPGVLKAIEEREKQNKFCHILLFHELPGTVKIMPVLIQELKARGYDFDTIEKVWLCQN